MHLYNDPTVDLSGEFNFKGIQCSLICVERSHSKGLFCLSFPEFYCSHFDLCIPVDEVEADLLLFSYDRATNHVLWRECLG